MRAETSDSLDFPVTATNVIKPKFKVTCHSVTQARLKAVFTADQNSRLAFASSTHILHLYS